jgi:hypothetical protein
MARWLSHSEAAHGLIKAVEAVMERGMKDDEDLGLRLMVTEAVCKIVNAQIRESYDNNMM